MDKEETKMVRIKEAAALRSFGLNMGDELPVCDAPEGHAAKFPGSIWVFSEFRNEPVRLLQREYQIL